LKESTVFDCEAFSVVRNQLSIPSPLAGAAFRPWWIEQQRTKPRAGSAITSKQLIKAQKMQQQQPRLPMENR
jgi:hypothetical protein